MLDGSGVEITSGEELADIVRRAAAAGWPVAVHAIGDLANREALDAFEQTQEHWRPKGLRPRIEHAQCVALEDLPRYAALGVAASVQFSHAPSIATSPSGSGDQLDGTYAFRTLVESVRSSRTARTRRSRSSIRGRASAPGFSERSTTVPPGVPSRP